MPRLPPAAPGDDPPLLELEVRGDLWTWRGPAPHHFVTVPHEAAALLHAVSPLVSYGWGCIPVRVRCGRTAWATSLFPRDGGFIVPIKAAVRAAEHLDVGQDVALVLTVRS
jgi:hypothetical protein